MCTNQLHLPKNSRERLKLVLIKDGFEEIEHEFPFGTFQNRTTFSDVSLLPEIFHRNDPKGRALFTFQPNDKLFRHCMD